MSKVDAPGEHILLKEIRAAVENNAPYDVGSFLQGYLSAAGNWAVWKDGEQWLGSGFSTLRELKRAVQQYTEEQS